MSTARRFSVRTATLLADFGHLVLMDPEHPDLQPGPRTSPYAEIGVAGNGMVQFFCAGQIPEPRVQFEIWTGEPPVPPDQGPGFIGEFETHHPRVVLGAPTAAPADIQIDLEPGRYGVRAFRGPSQVGPSGINADVQVEHEQWLIQLWPLANGRATNLASAG